jgi:hypothetical protein
VREVAIHRALRGRGWVYLFACWITVDRHGLSALAMTRWGEGCPRDDKVQEGIVGSTTLSLRGGNVSD